MKMYFFVTKLSYNLNEYDAYKVFEETEDFVSPKKYDYLRTDEFAIYKLNKKSRTKQSIKIRRALVVIAKEENGLVRYDEKLNLAFTKNNTYIFADRVQNDEEYHYHLNKYIGIKNPVVISLTKSNVCEYIELDNKTIYEYYKTEFVFPDWFRKFIKMRAFRAYSSMGFNFNTRRYNDTKWTAEEKFKHDFVKGNIDIYKVYFTLARVLDSKLDACGKGYPLSGLIYLALDIDGKCDGSHMIDGRGICIKCLENSNIKLAKAIEKIKGIPNLGVIKQLFSGTKGWHLHLEFNGKREVSEEILRYIIKTINKEEDVVDWFDGKEIDGVRKFDLYRILKCANSVDATTGCLVHDQIIRLDLKDKICEPKAMTILEDLQEVNPGSRCDGNPSSPPMVFYKTMPSIKGG